VKYSLCFTDSYVQPVTQQNESRTVAQKSNSVIKVVAMKNKYDFQEPSHATTKSTFFTISKNEWNSKEDFGKSMMHCSMPKGTSKAEGTSNSEKIKSMPLVIVKLC